MGKIDFGRWGADHVTDEQTPIPYLDIFGEDTPIDFLFENGGAPFIARGNVQTVKGREKTGKSAFGIALIVAALKGEFAGIKAKAEGTKILWIDTEQDNTTIRVRARAALEMAGTDEAPPALSIVTLRGVTPGERLQVMGRAIKERNPDFVFVDGAADLCADWNDNKESVATVGALLKATEQYKCALLCVIHTNKKDDEARGHLGTILQQKSSEVYEGTRAGDTATVKQALCRFAPAPACRFRFDEDFKILPAHGGESTAAAKVAQMKTAFGKVFEGVKEYRHKDLVAAYAEIEAVGLSAAKKTVKAAREAEIIFRNVKDGAPVYTYLFPIDYYPDDISNREKTTGCKCMG